jgi:hypothetical protein
VLDQAGYQSENQNAFVNLQILASPRAEIFATTFYNTGKASVRDFTYDSSNIVPVQAAGLDFGLMSSSFPGFSDLEYRSLTQTFGVNYRVSNALVLNTTVAINDNNDQQPYLYDTTGRRVGVIVGLNWVF